MKTTFIYSLSDDFNNIRYIGKSNNPKKRFYYHLKCCNRTNTHNNNWIKSLLKMNKLPILSIVDEVPVDNWQFWEIYWISKLKNEGHNLTNISTGGNGITKHRYNTVEKMIIKHKEFPNYNKCFDREHNLDKDELYQKYIIENLSLNKCASYFNVSKKTIFRNITEHNFKKSKSDWKDQLSTHKKKVVLQYSLDGILLKEYSCIDDAENELEVKYSNIANCCRGLFRMSNGFIWRYKDEFIPIKPLRRKSYNTEIIQYDLNMNEISRFKSISEAANKIGISRKLIDRGLKKILKTDKFIFKQIK
jgi:hypothetical protein